MQKRPSLTSVAAAVVAAVLYCGPAVAGSTDPELAIGEVVATASGQRAVVQVVGTWAFDDILQVDFPFNVVVSQGETFVRYPVGETAQSGSFPAIADGLGTEEIGALEAAGSDEPDARFVVLSSHRIVLALPPAISDGPVTVVGYVVVPGDGAVVSNAVTTTLSGVGGAP